MAHVCQELVLQPRRLKGKLSRLCEPCHGRLRLGRHGPRPAQATGPQAIADTKHLDRRDYRHSGQLADRRDGT